AVGVARDLVVDLGGVEFARASDDPNTAFFHLGEQGQSLRLRALAVRDQDFEVGVIGELEEAMQADRQEIGAIPRGDDGADTWPGLWSGITDAARATVFLHIDRLPSSECQPESIATRLSARRRKGFSVDDLTAMTKDVRDIHNRLPGRSRQPQSQATLLFS